LPTYDYECASCGHMFELRQSFSAEPQAACPHCEGVSRRKFRPVPIIYKGSGFYTTDYKHTGYSGTSKNGHEEDSGEKTKTAKATTGSSENKEDKKEAAKEA